MLTAPSKATMHEHLVWCAERQAREAYFDLTVAVERMAGDWGGGGREPRQGSLTRQKAAAKAFEAYQKSMHKLARLTKPATREVGRG